MLIAVLIASIVTAQLSTSYSKGRCTFNDYEQMEEEYSLRLDDSPGWCGVRYSSLNVSRITAVNGITSDGCNKCLEVSGSNGGPLVYVLAVDKKVDPGLDVAKTSFEALFPGSNPLDPKVCKWRIVDGSKCGAICQGPECEEGYRNLLPAYLMPPPVKYVPNAPSHITATSNVPAPIVTSITSKTFTTSPRSTKTNSPISFLSVVSDSAMEHSVSLGDNLPSRLKALKLPSGSFRSTFSLLLVYISAIKLFI